MRVGLLQNSCSFYGIESGSRRIDWIITPQKWNDVHVVQEDPEDFFGNVAHFPTPGLVWSWNAHAEDEFDRSSIIRFGTRFRDVREDLSGSALES